MQYTLNTCCCKTLASPMQVQHRQQAQAGNDTAFCVRATDITWCKATRSCTRHRASTQDARSPITKQLPAACCTKQHRPDGQSWLAEAIMLSATTRCGSYAPSADASTFQHQFAPTA